METSEKKVKTLADKTEGLRQAKKILRRGKNKWKGAEVQAWCAQGSV